MADMFAPLVAQLKANPKTIVFTEGNDPRILEAASKLLAEGVLKVVMVGNEAECKAAAAAGNFDISAAEIIDPENYAGFDETVQSPSQRAVLGPLCMSLPRLSVRNALEKRKNMDIQRNGYTDCRK